MRQAITCRTILFSVLHTSTVTSKATRICTVCASIASCIAGVARHIIG
jgi:hypothetical protein